MYMNINIYCMCVYLYIHNKYSQIFAINWLTALINKKCIYIYIRLTYTVDRYVGYILWSSDLLLFIFAQFK